jgi:toxin-antitoxin system PIN domain toxin
VNLPDTSVWLALSLSGHVFHAAARDWFARQSGDGSVVFCRATQQSFLRLLTTEAILRPYGSPAATNKEAWTAYHAFRTDQRIAFVSVPPSIDAVWEQLAVRGSSSPKLWMDAYFAAFAIAGRYKFVTTDTAFRQFTGLDLVILQ